MTIMTQPLTGGDYRDDSGFARDPGNYKLHTGTYCYDSILIRFSRRSNIPAEDGVRSRAVS